MTTESRMATSSGPLRIGGYPYMIAMAITVGGFASVDWITNTMIPQTLRHFTDNMLLISFIIALNRLFGFLVQPYVAWKSDRIRTRYGRRRPFFLVGLPFTAVSLMVVGAMPMLFTGDARRLASTIVILILANVILQFFQDVNFGSQEPLYADTFKHKVLGRAVGLRAVAIQVVWLFMNLVALRMADKNEIYPYVFSALFVLFSLALVIFVIRENPPESPPPEDRYNPLAHIGLLTTNSDYLKVAVIGALGLMLPAAFWLFNSLFARETLGLSNEQMGKVLWVNPLAGLAISIPTGYLVDRYGPKAVMASGYLFLALSCAGIAYFVNGFYSFLLFMILNGASNLMMSLPMTSMVFQYASDSERGTVFGLIQFVRGAAAFAFSLIVGTFVQFSRSSDPTPFYPQDVKKPADMRMRLSDESDTVARHLREHLSEATRTMVDEDWNEIAIGRNDDGSTRTLSFAQSLITDLNALTQRPTLIDSAAFQEVDLSRQSVKLLNRRTMLSEKQVMVLNRYLVEDALSGVLSRKADYRMSYVVSIVVSLLAGLVVLTTRKGKYAETILDAKKAQ